MATKGGSGGHTSSCLSVFGLPWDVKEREVNVLFSGCPGYARCLVVPGKSGQLPYAFVQFDSIMNAAMAMESRRGTTWEQGANPVSIEIAKRDIPDTFGPRQEQWAEPWSGVGWQSGSSGPGQASIGPWQQDLDMGQVPAAKRPRHEDAMTRITPVPQFIQPPPQQAQSDGPRTLHLGGLPAFVQQADLDSFLSTNFAGSCIGGTLASGGAKNSAFGRAFVGFMSHEAAINAQAILDGFSWEGAVLRAEWARTEYVPQGSGKGDASGGSVAAVPQPPPPQPAPPQPTPPLPALQWIMPGAKGGGASGKPGGGGSAKRTLMFTNLPFWTESEFQDDIMARFPEQIAAVQFKDQLDGRPPVAWALFVHEQAAEAALSQADQLGYRAAFARSELDPSKLRRPSWSPGSTGVDGASDVY